MRMAPRRAHRIHYAFSWENAKEGFGACKFELKVLADHDGDGKPTTYVRTGTIDDNGAKTGDMKISP